MPEALTEIPGPLFSVVIPTFNRAEKLRRALASLAAQSFADFEVLVCDDGSDDGSEQVAAQFAGRLRLGYLREENWGGPARPRNRGIAAAGGEWVCFLDADDWWYPNKLEAVRARLGQADFVYHDCDVHTGQGKGIVGKRGRQLGSPVFPELLTKGSPIVTIEDYELWLRISRLTDRFLHLPQLLGAYWVDDANISGFSENYLLREAAVLDRYQQYLGTADRQEAQRLLAYKTGVVRKHLGAFSECRPFFLEAMRSRRLKIKLYAGIYYLLSLIKSRFTIP